MDSPPVEDSDPDTAIALTQEEDGIAQKSPLSPPDEDEALELRESESQAQAHPDVRDSSTESDKTVLSITAAQDNRFPETPQVVNKIGPLSLPLPVPQIVVEEFHDSPSPLIDPSASPEESARIEQSPQCRQSRKTTPTPLVRIPKASSVPNASTVFEASAYEYEKLDDNTSSPPLTVSAFSSRSESPVSERGNSLLSLNAKQRLTHSDCALDFKKDLEPDVEVRRAGADCTSVSVAATRNGPKKKRLKKRSELNKSLVQLEEITKGSKDEILVESLAPISKPKSKRRSRLQKQLQSHGGVKSAVQSSSSSDGNHSHM